MEYASGYCCILVSMKRLFQDLNPREKTIFKRLNSPQKLQNFLETIPINFEKKGAELKSPRRVLKERAAHCFEGALFAAAVFWFHGKKPLLLDLKAIHPDYHHVAALFRDKERWGAISKTNHAVLRFRDPVYNNPRELAMSYFHEYFLDSGKKTLRSFAVFDLRKIKRNWIIDEGNLWYIDRALDRANHTTIVSEKRSALLRRADTIERKAGKLTVWKK